MNKFILSSLTIYIFIAGCKDSAMNPFSPDNTIAGDWKYSGPAFFVDSLDPEHSFSPEFIFNEDLSFEESAVFVEVPSRRPIGYKYVRTGYYDISSETIRLNIQNEIYLTFADSLDPKPVPVPINEYTRQYKFILNSDTLKLASLDLPGLFYFRYLRQ